MYRYLLMKLGRMTKRKLGQSKLASYGYSAKDIAGKALHPLKTIRAFGLSQKEQIKRNPFIAKLMKAKDQESKEYAEAFSRMSEEELPSMATLRVLSKKIKTKDPKQLIDTAINNPDRIAKVIEKMPMAEKEELRKAIESDTNEAPLSSSWLAYGTFVSKRNDEDKGELFLTTKTGQQFKTTMVTINVWEKMKKQIGVTTYDKDGKRKGSSYGAGTILHKYVPRSKWRKIQDPRESKKPKTTAQKAKEKLTPKAVKDMQKKANSVKNKYNKAKNDYKKANKKNKGKRK